MLGIFMAITARVLMVALFLPFSALDKFLNFRQAVGQAAEAVPKHLFAVLLICCGMGIEIAMSALLLAGIVDRLAACILAAYCIVTALLWKQFWRTPDFRLEGTSRGREVFWDFLKNLAVAGGFLLLAFGPTATSARQFLNDPFASSHPYATDPGAR